MSYLFLAIYLWAGVSVYAARSDEFYYAETREKYMLFVFSLALWPLTPLIFLINN
jgi:hypothetical protein